MEIKKVIFLAVCLYITAREKYELQAYLITDPIYIHNNPMFICHIFYNVNVMILNVTQSNFNLLQIKHTLYFYITPIS